jgi:hypothetical protein
MQSALTPAAAPTGLPQRKGANIALWVVQALLVQELGAAEAPTESIGTRAVRRIHLVDHDNAARDHPRPAPDMPGRARS